MPRRTGVALIAAAVAQVIGAAVYVATRHGSPPAPPTKTVLRADSRDLKNTLVVATDRAPLPEGKNVLWCASFQLAWDALRRDLHGGAQVALGPGAPADEVAALNVDAFPPGDLDPGAFVAMAGRSRDGIARRFQDAAKAKFGEEAADLDLPSLGPDEVAAFAMLLKNLPFEHPFEDYEAGIRFAGSKRTVRAFGMNRYSGNRDKQAIVGQVRIHMAEGPSPFARPESFVVELAVRGGRDRLLLACIDPEPTLRETWESVRDATRGPGEAAENDTVLAIPKLNFDVLHRFAELERAPAGLIAAFQRTQFRLDETGARLRSEAYAKQEALARTQFVFDRPFLIALIQKGAKRPYFLLWIANDELLTPE